MICPHCGAPAVREPMPNRDPLYVADDGGYDFDISLFTCTANSKHTFYTDDGAGNVSGWDEE